MHRQLGAAAAQLADILVRDAPGETLRLLSVVQGDQVEVLDPALWGVEPSADDIRSAVVGELHEQFSARRALEGASVTRAEAADLLGKREQAVSDDLDAGRLVGFKRGRTWFLPAWQFDAGSERGILPGLSHLQRAFPGGVVALTRWVTSPSPDLDGKAPRDALARGAGDRVIAVAGQLTAAGW